LEINFTIVGGAMAQAINREAKKWTMPIRDWRAALNQFLIVFGDRVSV
jgi:transposase-like protein